MPRSAAFVRIKEQVLQVVSSVPESRLCTYQSIGQHLDVMPRHVAYILGQLDGASRMVYPWYRIVAADGGLGTPKRGPDGRSQAELLSEEGITIVGNAVSPGLEPFFIPAADLVHGLPKQRRPAAGSPDNRGPAPPRRRTRPA